jgi:hypothetical protein
MRPLLMLGAHCLRWRSAIYRFIAQERVFSIWTMVSRQYSFLDCAALSMLGRMLAAAHREIK